ncbi:MFS transporter [Kitasatospora sp. NPDC093806]|uniref:MFS transporter n=1 Tax=Kitasatospora sp. NPDC093806 TaxID=3155075 RepID=UPI00343060AA
MTASVVPVPAAATRPVPATAPAGPARRRSTAALPAAALVAAVASGISGPSLALPAAAQALNAPAGSVAWLMTAYGLGLLVGTPLLAGTAGRRGPGTLIRAGAVLVALGAALVLAAPAALPALPALIAGRAVEAAGAAGLTIAAFRIAGRVPSGRSTGVVAIGNATGGTLGLFAGAGVAQAFGWRAALVLPLLALAVLPAALRSAGPTTPRTGPDSSPGAALPLGLLRDRAFRRPALLMLALATVNFALVYGAPRRVAVLSGWGTLPTGAAVAAVALAGALLSWQLVRAAPALGTGRVRTVLAAGSLAAAGAAAFAPWPAVVLLGSGVSSLVTAGGQGVLTAAAVNGLPPERRGGAIGLFNLAFPAGVAAGPVIAAFADQTVQFIY